MRRETKALALVEYDSAQKPTVRRCLFIPDLLTIMDACGMMERSRGGEERKEHSAHHTSQHPHCQPLFSQKPSSKNLDLDAAILFSVETSMSAAVEHCYFHSSE